MKYSKNRNPKEFEFDPESINTELNSNIKLTDLIEQNKEYHSNIKEKILEKSKNRFSSDQCEQITSEIIGLENEWGINLNIHFEKNMLNSYYDIKVGFKELKDELRKAEPIIFYDLKIDKLFIALEEYGFFPSENYKNSNDRINQNDCELLKIAKKELEIIYNNRATNLGHINIMQSSDKDTTLLLHKLTQIYFKIFKCWPSINENYGKITGASVPYYESILYALNRNIPMSTVHNFIKRFNQKSNSN